MAAKPWADVPLADPMPGTKTLSLEPGPLDLARALAGLAPAGPAVLEGPDGARLCLEAALDDAERPIWLLTLLAPDATLLDQAHAPRLAPRLSQRLVGIPAKVAAGLCTWEQPFSGFEDPIGSCLEKATHGFTGFEGRKDFTYCAHHAAACATPGGPYRPYPLEA